LGVVADPSQPEWIDDHCHLDGADDAEVQVRSAHAAGVVGMITVGTTVERSLVSLDLARRLPGVWSTAGVHPHDACDGTDGLESLVRSGRLDGRLVAVGECGLDYHYRHSPVPVQREVFTRQVELANELDLPLVIHTREAWEDTFELLDLHGVPQRTVFHCFTGGTAEANEALRRGALLSISGIVTFPSARSLQEAVAVAPLHRLMVETDSPYLAPVPHRGSRNTPERVVHVGAAVAELQERDLSEVSEQTVATTVAFYGLDPDELVRTGSTG
jgi:TatD DNase family protein